ncbi:MAG: hypothetical protein KDD82_08440, partial [Planctomycetes bacterium]|nr:hypothetical protein [Planctomycetota bacterium]
MNPDSETADGAAAPDDETTARGARGGARSSGAGEETHAPRARSSGLTDPDDGTEAWRRPRATAATPAPSPAPDAASAETEGGARSPRRA